MVSSNVVPCPSCGKKNRVPDAAKGAPRCASCKAPLPWIADAGDASFAEIVEAAKTPVLVDLWAPWCGPCRMVEPDPRAPGAEMAGRLKLVKVNVDDSPQLAQRFGVQGIPTLILMVGGQEKARQTGAAPEHVLRTWLEHHTRGPPPNKPLVLEEELPVVVVDQERGPRRRGPGARRASGSPSTMSKATSRARPTSSRSRRREASLRSLTPFCRVPRMVPSPRRSRSTSASSKPLL